MRPKIYDELTFTDDFMFCKVLENDPDLCREIIELILNRKIRIVKNSRKQKVIEIIPDGRGIRLDVVMEGDDSVYELEMQNGHRKELPKRARYYQALTDLDMLERGSRYDALKKTVLIFICTFDPFSRGLGKYTVRKIIEEDPEFEYNDETEIIFLSSLPQERSLLSESLRAFLSFVNGGVPESELTKRLESAVQRARSQQDWRKEYMLLYEIKDDAREEGREEGLKQGRAELIRAMYEEKIPMEQIIRISKKTEEEILEIINKQE